MSEGPEIRAARPQDSPALLALNAAAEPGVSRLAEDDLADILRQAWATLVAAEDDTPLGLLIALRPGAAYHSPNYHWFERRFAGDRRGFLYVDRIAVSAKARGLGLGAALYDALFAQADPAWPVCAEVNLQPPNPGSLRFHARLGFEQVGRAVYTPGVKEVAFLQRAPRRP